MSKGSVEKVREAVEKLAPEYNVVSAYLFGSFARNEENKDSDIDIAVYFEDYSLKKVLELGRKIADEADIDREIDLRALNNKKTGLAFRVISEGEVIYEEDKSKRADIELQIERRYHDIKPYKKEYRQEMMRSASIIK